MSDDENSNAAIAECGACREIIPLNSSSCPGCGVSFSGVSDEALGECGACSSLMPLDSPSCSSCGVVFVADDVIEVMSRWLKSTNLTVVDLFAKFDENNDGEITSEEFKNGLLSLNLADLPPSQVERLVEAIDEDGNGVIDLEELSNTFDVDFEPTKTISTTEESESEESDDAEDVGEDEESEEEDAEDEVDSEEEDSDTEDEAEEESDDEVSEEEADEDSEEEADGDDDSDSEEESDEEEEEEEEEEVFNPEDSFKKLAEGITDAGMTIKEAFESFDVNEDGMIDGPELQKGLESIGDGLLPPKEVMAVLSTIDEDENGLIDAMEFIAALEKVAPELRPKDPTFPTDTQRMLMGKKWNDIWWPLIHTGFAIFAVLWLVNGLGLIVDGTGGAVEYDGDAKIVDDDWLIPGDVYPCDPEIQESKCQNTLTPLSGSESSMPAGFYWDTILFMLVGLFGFVGSMIMHLVIVKQWRVRARGLKEQDGDEESEDSDDLETEEAEEESEQESDDSGDDESEEEDSEEDVEEEDSEDEESDDEEDSDDDDDEEDDDDEIDIGSKIGLELDEEEFFGEIIEFDDDEGTVTIIDEESGDEITGMQDDMFLE